MENPFDYKPADDILYAKGQPPVGRETSVLSEDEKAESLDGVYHGATLPNEEDVNVGSPGCQRCEVLPRPLRGPGTVHLRFGHTHTLGKALGFLAGSTWEHWEKNGTLSIHVPVGELAPLLSPILDRMSSVESRDTRAFFQPDGQLADAPDYFEVEALPEFVTRARSGWVLDLLRQKLLYPVFHPLIRIPDAPCSGSSTDAAAAPATSPRFTATSA